MDTIDILIPPPPEDIELPDAQGGTFKVPLAKRDIKSNILVEEYPVSKFPSQVITILKECGYDHTRTVQLFAYPSKAIVGDLILLPGDDEHPLRIVGMYGLKAMKTIQVYEGPFVIITMRESGIYKGYVVYYDSRDASVMVLLVKG